MIWKSLIAPLLFLIFILIVIYLSKRDLEDIQIQKKQNSEPDCQKCNSSKSSIPSKEYQSIEYIVVQDIDEEVDSEEKS